MPYTLLPHTADLRASVQGSNLFELYQAAVDLVRDTIVGTSPVAALELRTLEVSSGLPADERLFRFVRELLYLFDTEVFLPARLADLEPLQVWGERFDPARHCLEHQVKAVTRHGFTFEASESGSRAELLFDL